MKINNHKRRITKKVVLLGIIILLILSLISDLTVTVYNIKSPKLNKSIRIALITDLHSCDYGEGQDALIKVINQNNPDLLLLGGDIVDDDLPRKKAYEFLSVVSKEYPCFYVSGNHEFWSDDIDSIKDEIKAYGVTILEGEKQDIEIKGQIISIFGIDDPEIGEYEFVRQLKNCGKQIDSNRYSILLTHRPERINSYLNYDFDLVLAGHTHGGQIRIPGLINGLSAPDQGLFPQYAGGRYELGESIMIVSRGLARESTRIPRVFNLPEVVIVNLLPES